MMNTAKLEWIGDGAETFTSMQAACTFLASHNKYRYQMTSTPQFAPAGADRPTEKEKINGPCTAILDDTQLLLHDLSNVICALEERLNVVLSSSPTNPMEDKMPTCSCKLEEKLMSHRHQLGCAVGNLRNLIDRIQI